MRSRLVSWASSAKHTLRHWAMIRSRTVRAVRPPRRRITFVWLSHIAGPKGQWGVTRKNGKEITMDARLNYYGSTVAAKFAKYINSAGTVVSNSTLPAATQELVKIRASQ